MPQQHATVELTGAAGRRSESSIHRRRPATSRPSHHTSWLQCSTPRNFCQARCLQGTQGHLRLPSEICQSACSPKQVGRPCACVCGAKVAGQCQARSIASLFGTDNTLSSSTLSPRVASPTLLCGRPIPKPPRPPMSSSSPIRTSPIPDCRIRPAIHG